MLTAPASQAEIGETIAGLFAERGASQYGGEGVSQEEHALQSALMAEEEGASPELIAAALLHDVGHLLHDLPDDAPDNGVDDVHEKLAADWLAGKFKPEVIAAVGLHVTAKRYLCGSDPEYYATLSEPSKVSLALQGGPMSAAECAEFQRHKYFASAIRLRKWDDAAKIPNLPTPSVEHYLKYVRQAAV
jgi:phosphonate degradation associated HDIG domain protein